VLWYARLQAVGFADSQHVTINHTIWVAGPNSATLSGAGLGLNASWLQQWSAKVYIAAPLGSTPTLIGSNDSVRVWLALNKGF
jgi:hemolysin activation/secretion protein